MPERSNADIIRIVTKWQNIGMVHELTCAVDARHEMLEPIEHEGKVVLECPSCGAIQEKIPEFVLTSEAGLDFSISKYAERQALAERRQQREDVWITHAASVIGSGLLGSLWFGTPGGFGGILFGFLVAWRATRTKRKALSRP
jgi:hypothetical protein